MLPSDAGFVVLKFGGTSVSTASRLNTIASVMKSTRAEGVRVVTVVSALSKVTDALKALCEQPDNVYLDGVDAIEARHVQFANELQVDVPSVLSPLFDALRALHGQGGEAQGGAKRFLWQAEVLSFGELLSSRLAVASLQKQGLDVQWLDARTLLRAIDTPFDSEWGQALSVNCLHAPSPDIEQNLALSGEMFLTQGFIARNARNQTVILGRGGSDTSAAYMGSMLQAKRVEIWTDVPGMFSANPRLVPEARLLRRLDYDEAQEMASTGAKVLHPRCLAPCRDGSVPLWVKDTEHPQLPGTCVSAQPEQAAKTMKALSVRTGLVLVSMETVQMWQRVGFLSDVFEQYKRLGLSVGLIATSETNVTVSLDPQENLLDGATLQQLRRRLEPICRVQMHKACAAITVVGRGMRALLHRLTPVLETLEQRHIYLVTQSSDDLNFTVVVDEAAAHEMLPTLHAMLVKSGAMRLDDSSTFGPKLAELI
jgi:bifunctional diaminopimelate decarboxylase / aspartate kinase